jgi:hypothetical protein
MPSGVNDSCRLNENGQQPQHPQFIGATASNSMVRGAKPVAVMLTP